MKSEKQSVKSETGKNGGVRPGAGRPKGSVNKLTAKHLLESIKEVSGKDFNVLLAEGYNECIIQGDRKHRTIYERMLLDKVATNMFDVEVNDSEESIENKKRAFAEALVAFTKNPG